MLKKKIQDVSVFQILPLNSMSALSFLFVFSVLLMTQGIIISHPNYCNYFSVGLSACSLKLSSEFFSFVLPGMVSHGFYPSIQDLILAASSSTSLCFSLICFYLHLFIFVWLPLAISQVSIHVSFVFVFSVLIGLSQWGEVLPIPDWSLSVEWCVASFWLRTPHELKSEESQGQSSFASLSGRGPLLLRSWGGHGSSLDVATSLLRDWLFLCFSWSEERMALIWGVSFLVRFNF